MDWKRLLVGKWDWKRPIKSVIFIYLCLAVVACTMSNHFIFQPPPAQYARDHPALVMLGDDGARTACLYHAPAPGKPLLLWSHGNAEDLGTLAPLLAEIHARGYGILAYDYPGYGLSDGAPTERGCYEAAERGYQYLTGELHLDPRQILVFGQSVGSGPACWLAEKHETGGLILVAPFLSAFRTVTRIPLFPGDKFKNIKRIGAIKGPVLIINGPEDHIIAPAQGKRLYDLHPGPKRFLEIPKAGHNNIWHLGFNQIMAAIDDLANGRIRLK